MPKLSFYTIPYAAIADLLIAENLYLTSNRKRWVGDISHHILRIRNSKKERNLMDYFSAPVQIGGIVIALNQEDKNDYAIENAKREIGVRVKQSLFRQKVLANFQYRCCLSGITELSLLVASHIIPWSAQIETRLAPYNGLCLSVLYDKLFDLGYFTFDDNYTVLRTERNDLLSPGVRSYLREIDGKKMAAPVNYQIDAGYIRYHRETIFDRSFKYFYNAKSWASATLAKNCVYLLSK